MPRQPRIDLPGHLYHVIGRGIAKARAMYCYLGKERCGVSGAELMKQLRLTSGAISHLVYKGRELHKR